MNHPVYFSFLFFVFFSFLSHISIFTLLFTFLPHTYFSTFCSLFIPLRPFHCSVYLLSHLCFFFFFLYTCLSHACFSVTFLSFHFSVSSSVTCINFFLYFYLLPYSWFSTFSFTFSHMHAFSLFYICHIHAFSLICLHFITFIHFPFSVYLSSHTLTLFLPWFSFFLFTFHHIPAFALLLPFITLLLLHSFTFHHIPAFTLFYLFSHTLFSISPQ